MASTISDDLRASALAYHRAPKPGKLEIQPTKPLGSQRDLALAYSPGVAAACEAIVADPAQAAELTARANLVAVVSNGTAVLGLGNIGPLAGKPVMEGKAVLFKKFAGIDVFDIEIDAHDCDHVVTVVAALEPTFGGINLEDFKAPECFEIEDRLKARMKIPVFHDDQHGTAIIVGAAVQNALSLTGKKINEVKIVASGAGAAALACLNLIVSLGAQRRKHLDHGYRGRRLRGPREADGPLEIGLRAENRQAEAGRGHRRRRHLSRPLRARRAEARDGEAYGGQAADHGACQSDAGDLARGSRHRASRRDDLHRTVRLPEPGQQRPVLSLHLPRRARCQRDHDQRGDEARGGRGDRGARARSSFGRCGQGLWRRIHAPSAPAR